MRTRRALLTTSHFSLFPACGNFQIGEDHLFPPRRPRASGTSAREAQSSWSLMASSSASTSTLGLGAGGTASAFEGADDPNDWEDDYAFLKALDSSLRCEVCYVSPPSLVPKVD